MPLPKKEVMRRIRLYFEKQVKDGKITKTEYTQVILYCKHTLNLLERLKKEGFVINRLIQGGILKKELSRVSKLQNTSDTIRNNFLYFIKNTKSTSLTLINPENNISRTFLGDCIVMSFLWSYVTNGELIGQFLKTFVDFQGIYNSLNNSQKSGISQNSLDKEKITLNIIMILLKKKYNTSLFKDVDISLRNSISHCSFNFYKGKISGIKFYYKPHNNLPKKKRVCNLNRLILINKKINILLNAVTYTSCLLLE